MNPGTHHDIGHNVAGRVLYLNRRDAGFVDRHFQKRVLVKVGHRRFGFGVEKVVGGEVATPVGSWRACGSVAKSRLSRDLKIFRI